MEKKILLIEDSDDDFVMIKRSFKKGKIGNCFHRVHNGNEGLDYLQNTPHHTIELILLDLNMELMSGFEFLRQRMRLPKIKKIPVVVLTTSQRKEDIDEAYELGANCYIAKPLDPKEFIDILVKTEEFWIFIAKKPSS